MYHKYTLTFQDQNIESQFQEYMTNAIRQTILIAFICCQFLSNTMDLIEALVSQQLYQMTIEIILSQYIVNYFIAGLFIMIHYFKPHWIRFLFIVSNILFAYGYWTQEQIYSYQQAALNTYLIISAQMLTLMTSNCIEMVLQIILFTCAYVLKMKFEEIPYQYSLLINPMAAAFFFILILFKVQKNLREQFKVRFMNNQWESILQSLLPGNHLEFDYEPNTYSFNYLNQKNFSNKIVNSQTLREFLRLTTHNNQCLERYLHLQIAKSIENNEEILEIHSNTKFTSFTKIKVSTFIGIRPIIIIQVMENDGYSSNHNSTLQYQTYLNLGKQFLFQPKNKIENGLRQFRKHWIYARKFINSLTQSKKITNLVSLNRQAPQYNYKTLQKQSHQYREFKVHKNSTKQQIITINAVH